MYKSKFMYIGMDYWNFFCELCCVFRGFFLMEVNLFTIKFNGIVIFMLFVFLVINFVLYVCFVLIDVNEIDGNERIGKL